MASQTIKYSPESQGSRPSFGRGRYVREAGPDLGPAGLGQVGEDQQEQGGSVGRTVRNLIMSTVLKRDTAKGETRLQWVRQHRIDWDTPVGDVVGLPTLR